MCVSPVCNKSRLSEGVDACMGGLCIIAPSIWHKCGQCFTLPIRYPLIVMIELFPDVSSHGFNLIAGSKDKLLQHGCQTMGIMKQKTCSSVRN